MDPLKNVPLEKGTPPSEYRLDTFRLGFQENLCQAQDQFLKEEVAAVHILSAESRKELSDKLRVDFGISGGAMTPVLDHFWPKVQPSGVCPCLLCSKFVYLVADVMRSLMQETVEHEQPELLVPKGKKPRVSYPDYMRGFWGALVHAKEIDGSLQLPEPHVWSPDHGNKIFVRGCYRELADAILNDAGLESNDSPVPLKKGTHYWTILGNPGIGKTVFIFYLMYRLRRISSVTNVVLQAISTEVCIDYSGERIFPRAELPLGSKPGWWFLFDSKSPPIGLEPSVLVTSPKFEIWKQFDRQTNARKFVMPVWSFAELCSCRSRCFPTVSEEFVKQAFGRWGGICRYVLAKTGEDDQAGLKAAIESANIDTLKSFAAETLTFSSEMPHPLLHFLVSERYSVEGVAWASEYVSHEVTNRLLFKGKADVAQLLAATEGVKHFGALRGLLFEEVAHSVLQRGGNFTYVYIDDSSSVTTAAAATISIEPLKMKTFRTVAELGPLAAPGLYARPSVRNFAGVDAVLIPSDNSAPVLLLQMTVSTSHPIKLAAVVKIRKEIPPSLKARGVHFVFVVPADVACDFTKQPFHTLDGTVAHHPPSDVPQYLLTVREYVVQK